jgi:hypothetical protein
MPWTKLQGGICDYRTGKTRLLRNRTVVGHFSKMRLHLVKPYSSGIGPHLTRINESGVPFMPSCAPVSSLALLLVLSTRFSSTSHEP